MKNKMTGQIVYMIASKKAPVCKWGLRRSRSGSKMTNSSTRSPQGLYPNPSELSRTEGRKWEKLRRPCL